MDITALIETAFITSFVLQALRLAVFRSPWTYLDEAEFAASGVVAVTVGQLRYADPAMGIGAAALALIVIELYVVALKASAVVLQRRR